MEIIRQWVKKANKYISRMDFSSGAMRYILLYAALLMACCLIYLAAWAVLWYLDGRPNLKELLSFLHEIAGASWVAVVGFVAKAFVDKNKNGIPDEYEDLGDERKESGTHDEQRISERNCPWPGRDRR